MIIKNKVRFFDNSVKFNLIKFKFGRQIFDIKHYARLGILFKGSISLLSLLPGLNEENVFNFIDEMQLFFNIEVLNDYIIRDQDFLKYRIKRTLDKAFQEYFGKINGN